MEYEFVFQAIKKILAGKPKSSRPVRAFTSYGMVFPALLVAVGASFTNPAIGEERLELDGMAVIGNRELPKALFIVPWKDPEHALAPDRPINTLLDEALQPVDPEVFQRKLQYYDIVHRKD